MRRSKIMDNRGFFKGLLGLAVLVGVVYAGIMFGTPYYRYNTLRSHTKDILSMENPIAKSLPGIKEHVMAEAVKLNIPLEEGNLDVLLDSNKILHVKARWSEVVNLGDYYSKKFDFEMDVEY